VSQGIALTDWGAPRRELRSYPAPRSRLRLPSRPPLPRGGALRAPTAVPLPTQNAAEGVPQSMSLRLAAGASQAGRRDPQGTRKRLAYQRGSDF
jgi:hypothetical protein